MLSLQDDFPLAPKYQPDYQHSIPPIMVFLDETPRAAQTLRFTIDNLIHDPNEDICILFALPPCKSTLLKNKVTSRIKSFLTLITEKYEAQPSRPHLKLYLLDQVDLLPAIAQLTTAIQPRMFVMGSANVSFTPPTSTAKVLQVGTGAQAAGYYTSTFVPPTPESPVLGPLSLHSQSSYASLTSSASADAFPPMPPSHVASPSLPPTHPQQHAHHDGILGGLETLWHSISSLRKSSFSGNGDVTGHVPEGKSAYVVEGGFADAVKEHVTAPVVVVKVTLPVS